MSSLFNHYPSKPKNQLLLNSYIILVRTHDTASSFLDIFNQKRRTRNARGAPTDEEKDLLRAMLIFATSGLDSLIKQIIRDALPTIIDLHDGSAEHLKLYVEKRIKSKEEIDHKFIAQIIVDKKPRNCLINDLINDLTSYSIQSLEQILKVAAFFDIPSKKITSNNSNIKQIFHVRNQIAHEMDIDLIQPYRNRRSRRQRQMIQYTNDILELALNFLNQVKSKLPS